MSSVFIGAYDRTMQTLNRTHRAPAEPLPPHAADCHMHVFGPFERHPLAPQRAYNVPEASLAAHQRMKAQVGLERTVFVQAIDHMGLPDAAHGVEQPVFQTVLQLAGKAWVKIAGADRITRSTGNLRDAIPFIRALAQAAPQRLVWGSDWPNIGFHTRQQVHDDSLLAHRELDAGELLDVLLEAVPDADTRSAILARNPEALYGFSTSS